MANPLPSPLTTDLPTNWTRGQIVAPTGQEVGLPNNYGYNYLMAKVNEARTAINTINDAFTNLPDANTLAQYLKLSGGTMTGNITMSSGAKVTGLPTPTENADAVPKNYVDQQLSQGLEQYLKLTGGTMTGNITMSSGSKVTGLPTPTENADAVPKDYVDTALANVPKVELVFGTYTGNEADEQSINLGFQPKAVFVRSKEFLFLSSSGGNYYLRSYFEYAISGMSKSTGSSLRITDTGFTAYIGYDDFGSRLNSLNKVYSYFAIKG